MSDIETSRSSERERVDSSAERERADAASARSALPTRSFERAQWRQLALITVAAVAIYVTLRSLPTGTNLNHMDFRVQGKNSIEFCDPLNPQFIPVVAARSPVTMTVATQSPVTTGEEARGVLTLRTSSGKPIAPEDLLVVHTQLLHLMIVDPSLTDYQHVHPKPTRTAGEWTFTFTPRLSGTYRLFADFTPVATARGLYANADLEVRQVNGAATPPRVPPSESNGTVVREGFELSLTPAARPMRVRQPIDFTFRIVSQQGGRVPLQPIMGAYAHLVAFDSSRSGFAHLHPTQADPLQPPDPTNPVLKFKLTIPAAGRYVIWAQINLNGHEVFAPFWFDVVE